MVTMMVEARKETQIEWVWVLVEAVIVGVVHAVVWRRQFHVVVFAATIPLLTLL